MDAPILVIERLHSSEDEVNMEWASFGSRGQTYKLNVCLSQGQLDSTRTVHMRRFRRLLSWLDIL